MSDVINFTQKSIDLNLIWAIPLLGSNQIILKSQKFAEFMSSEFIAISKEYCKIDLQGSFHHFRKPSELQHFGIKVTEPQIEGAVASRSNHTTIDWRYFDRPALELLWQCHNHLSLSLFFFSSENQFWYHNPSFLLFLFSSINLFSTVSSPGNRLK